MIINTDINILGGLPDWKLIYVFLNEDLKTIRATGGIRSVTTIKTDRSVVRFEKAITNTLLKFKNEDVESLFRSIIMAEEISADSLLFMFWNASSNNELLHAGPRPALFFVHGVVGRLPPYMLEHPVAFATSISLPNSWETRR